jgi:predicted nucleic acid-binding Zn ribbon protein
MPIQIPNHSHCVMCTRAVEFGEKTCSERCAADLAALQKKRRQSSILLWVMMGLAAVVALLGVSGWIPK